MTENTQSPAPETLTPEQRAANLRRRNWATLAIIVAFCALIYAVGIIKMSGA